MCSKKFQFTSSERELIVALVRERPIIEAKRTHARNIELKKKAWDELTIAYNAQPYVTRRNNVQLKRCWENIKSQRKKELSRESTSMMRTGGGPPEGGPAISSDNVVDAICPFINLTVPGVIDSNSTENDLKVLKEYKTDIDVLKNNTEELNKEKILFSTKIVTDDVCDPKNCCEIINMDTTFVSEVNQNVTKAKKRKEMSTNNTVFKKFTNETEARIKRSTMNMQQDAELHELRLHRERILIEREENLLHYEKQFHALQLEKIKLEIELLKRKS